MTENPLPSFEDLEPEGENLPDYRESTGEQRFVDPDLEGLTMDALGEYELMEYDELDDFDDLADLEGSEASMTDPFDEPHVSQPRRRRQRPPNHLSGSAARAALKWGKRGLRSNGDETGASRRGVPAGQLGSAAVREAHELMQALALAAARSEDETEATGLAAALVPVAAGLAPNVYRGLWPALPALVRGAMGLTRQLHRRPSTRGRIRHLPEIMQQTIGYLERDILRERSVSRRRAADVLARVTDGVLSRRHATRNVHQPRRQSRRHYRDERF